MALGLYASLSRRVLSRCRATSAALPLRQSPLAPPELLPKSPYLTQERSIFSGKRPDLFLDKLAAADYIEMTGPKGRLQSVHWPDRPDVFGPTGADGLPLWVNWTRWPAVCPVADQGSACCWAHSTAASVEALNSICTDHLVELSAQQLMDCVKKHCEGEEGFPIDALNYIVKNGGILSAADYPYVGYRQPPQNIVAPGVTLDNCVRLTDVDEHYLKGLVAQQLVIALIGADRRFVEYLEGVIDGPNYSIRTMLKRGMSHTVPIVGYGELKGLLFWLIKNSWSRDWGCFGFAFIARNNGKQGGAFGIAREIVYPIKVSPNSLAVKASAEI